MRLSIVAAVIVIITMPILPQGSASHVESVARAALPIAAQRWLDRALPPDLDLPSSVQIE